MATKPLLTIGMIFKNEIRCLERCMEALRPLRDAVPCQLVMADTGSTDGSREVAEQYADVLFDFPWINDFSAARNAVMDRASGEWFLTVDCDEYLDPDVSELKELLRNSGDVVAGLVIQRNYDTLDMRGSYRDFFAQRLVRMDAGFRYQGSIHESLERSNPRKAAVGVRLARTVLHHDGYAGLNEEQGEAKRERNLRLLRKELEKTPDSLRRLFQYVESGIKDHPDAVDKLRRSLELVEGKAPGWERFGPPLYRYAVYAALHQELPELETWAKRGEELFPRSYFIRIDVQSLMFAYAWNKKQDYAEAIRRAEAYLKACADYDAEPVHPEWEVSTVAKAAPADRQNMRVFLARAYIKEALPEKALALLMDMRMGQLDPSAVRSLTEHVLVLHSHSSLDTAPLVRKLWEDITAPEPDREAAWQRRAAFLSGCLPVFAVGYRNAEKAQENIRRLSYTALAPLADVCAVGIGAAALESWDPAEIAELLGGVERWNELPHAAVFHAVRMGVPFPPEGTTLFLEEMDELAERMAQEPKTASNLLARALGTAGSAQDRSWARALALALVNACQWEDEEDGLLLVRRFAEAEAAFLPLCYAPEALTREGLALLPPMHRFGWWCAQAFAALDGGDAVEYTRLLRQGLKSCEQAKPMVEFLLENTPELRGPKPSPELLALAEQVRTMLAAYAPDDPAVVALKESPIYQEVAYLIEGGET